MKCPACYDELRELQVGSLKVDACPACGGVWFDAFELQKADDEEEVVGERLQQINRDSGVVVDPSKKRQCPRCEGVKLHRHFFSAQRRVQIDQCPNCAGYWLDAGELAAIRAEKGAAAQREKLQEGFISIETIRYLYRIQQSRVNPR